METKRCIFCMHEMNMEEQKCPFCKKAIWQYAWKDCWLKPYTVLRDRYFIGSVLGEGAFGVTYLSFDERKKEPVAIKAYVRDADLKEVEILEEINGIPGIVNIKEYFEDAGNHYLVMEYVEGGSLKTYLNSHHMVSAEKAEEMLLPVMRSLLCLHGKGIIHGDVSPDNLLFDKSGKLKLIDFGAAVRSGEITETKKLKEGYAPIEQYQEKEKIGPWTDLYAICAVWYELVTGHKIPSAPERLKKDMLREANSYAKIPADMEEAYMRGLSLDIQKRYFSMNNLLIKRQISEESVREEASLVRKEWGNLWIQITTEVERSSIAEGKQVRRKRWMWNVLAAAAGVILTVAIVAAGIVFYGKSHPEIIVSYLKKQDLKYAEKIEQKPLLYGTDEWKKAEEFLDEKSYEVDESGIYNTYRILPEALEEWEYPSLDAGNFPIRRSTAIKAMDLFAGAKREEETDRFEGYVSIEKKEGSIATIDLRKVTSWKYGEDRVSLESDEKTDLVIGIYYQTDHRETAERFYSEIVPLVSPENMLKKEEIKEILDAAEQTREYASIQLNAKCSISTDVDGETYHVSIGE